MNSVEENQRGIVTSSGEIKEILPPGGPYTSTNPYTSMTYIDVAVHGTKWSDPSLVSLDLQPIGVSINVDYRRPRNDEDLVYMWQNYNEETRSNDALRTRVESKIFSAAKTASSQLSVQQMLGTETVLDEQRVTIARLLRVNPEEIAGFDGRGLFEYMIVVLLQEELNDSRIEVVAVTADDIAPSEEFISLLERGANARQEQDVLIQEERTLSQQLENERAQSRIDEEIARRNAEITRIEGEAWESSPSLLALRLAEIYTDAIDRGDTIIFVPEGSSIANILSPGAYSPEELLPIIDELNAQAEE